MLRLEVTCESIVAGRDGTRLQHKCPCKKMSRNAVPLSTTPRTYMIVANEQEHSPQDRATLLCLAFVTPQLQYNTEFWLLPFKKDVL